jgi:hypothetical protein
MLLQHHVISPQHGQEEKHQKVIQPGVSHAQSHIQHVKHRQSSSQASTKVLVKICYKQTSGLDYGLNATKRDTYLRGLEGVVWGEMNGDQKHSSCVRTVWRAHDGSLPMEHVLRHRSCYKQGRRNQCHCLQLQSHQHYRWSGNGVL